MKPFKAIDLFCGAGGTSTGLIKAARAADRQVDLTAVNHWDIAIKTHTLNHPDVRHLCEPIDHINPRKVFPDRRINLLVASPECTHHSNARGGVPCSDQSRATAWKVIEWASALYIDNILIENVPEFESWGPLGVNGRPMKSKRGETFQAFKIALQSLGYRVDHQVLNAADYGDPTCRRRFFLIARRGNKRIRWPEPTHTKTGGKDLFGMTRPWVPAREIIDWSIPGESIFDRKKPLAEKTLARIEYGLRKFGGEEFLAVMKGRSTARSLNAPLPTLTTKQNMYLCEPYLLPQQAGHKEQLRVRSIDKPLSTLTATGAEMLVEPCFLVGIDHKSAGEKYVRSLERPAPTAITQQNYALIQAYIIKYFGNGRNVQSIDNPLDTITTKDRFGLVQVFEQTPGPDIRLRMLQPHELAAAQSFPVGYKFAGTKGQVVKQIGNAVPVKTAKALCKELMA